MKIFRRRSRSPRSSRNNKNRSHRDRSDSRERDRRRNRNGPRNDKDSGRNNDRRPVGVDIDSKTLGLNQINPNNPQIFQNAPFNGNLNQILMNKQQTMPMNNAIDTNLLNHPNEQMSAFSTNDVRTMNMNMTLQANPLAFQQQIFNQQQVGMPAFNSQFLPGAAALQNPANKFGNGIGISQSGENSSGNTMHCVRVRNLCNLTNYSALRKFFTGLLIPNDGIKMINDVDGNRTGQAYVRFGRPSSVMLAVQRSNQKLGRNIIQIQELDDKTYDEAVDSYRPRRNNNYRSDYDRDRDRDRDSRDGREGREGRDGREGRESRDGRDARDNRDNRDTRDTRGRYNRNNR